MILPRAARAVIFDLDGVLWHSERAHAEAYHRTLAPLGVDVPGYEHLAGRRTDEVIASLLAEEGIKATPKQVAKLTAAKRDAAYEILKNAPPIARDCAAVLDALSARYKLALASSASARSVQLFLDASGTAAAFEVVLSAEDAEAAKPAPHIYQATLQRLGLEGQEAIAVEDAVPGILAARAAGIPVVAVAGTCTSDELARSDVLAVISSLADIVADAAPNH